MNWFIPVFALVTVDTFSAPAYCQFPMILEMCYARGGISLVSQEGDVQTWSVRLWYSSN